MSGITITYFTHSEKQMHMAVIEVQELSKTKNAVYKDNWNIKTQGM